MPGWSDAPARPSMRPRGERWAAITVLLAEGQIVRKMIRTPASATNQCRKVEGNLRGAAPITPSTVPSAKAGQRSPVAASDSPSRPKKTAITATARSAKR